MRKYARIYSCKFLSFLVDSYAWGLIVLLFFMLLQISVCAIKFNSCHFAKVVLGLVPLVVLITFLLGALIKGGLSLKSLIILDWARSMDSTNFRWIEFAKSNDLFLWTALFESFFVGKMLNHERICAICRRFTFLSMTFKTLTQFANKVFPRTVWFAIVVTHDLSRLVWVSPVFTLIMVETFNIFKVYGVDIVVSLQLNFELLDYSLIPNLNYFSSLFLGAGLR